MPALRAAGRVGFRAAVAAKPVLPLASGPARPGRLDTAAGRERRTRPARMRRGRSPPGGRRQPGTDRRQGPATAPTVVTNFLRLVSPGSPSPHTAPVYCAVGPRRSRPIRLSRALQGPRSPAPPGTPKNRFMLGASQSGAGVDSDLYMSKDWVRSGDSADPHRWAAGAAGSPGRAFAA